MSDRLLLRLAPDGGLTWLRQVESASIPQPARAGVPPAEVLRAASSVVVLVPGEDVLLTETRLEARSRTQLLQALPYAIEERLLSPVEELHFAATTGGPDLGVAVVAKSVLSGWQVRLAEAGIEADVLIPETLALPLAPSGACVLIEPSRASVRLGPWSAFTCEPDELPNWLSQAGADADIAPLQVYDVRNGGAMALPVAVETYHPRVPDPLAFLARGLDHGTAPRGSHAINLLQGEFAPRHRRGGNQRWWRVAASLAAAAVLLAVAHRGVEVVQLSRTSARMQTLAQDAVRRSFPDLDATQLARLTPEQLMRGRLDRLRGGAEASGLLRVLAQIGPVLASTSRMQTRGMEYRNGTLELHLGMEDVAALDSVRERLALVPGLKVEVTSANPQADGVDGRLRISGDVR